MTWKVTLCDDDDVDDDIEHNVDDDVDELMLIIRRKRMIVTFLTRMITGAQFLIWGCKGDFLHGNSLVMVKV